MDGLFGNSMFWINNGMFLISHIQKIRNKETKWPFHNFQPF